MIRLLLIALVLLAGCQDRTGGTAQNNRTLDKTKQSVYTDLMSEILGTKIGNTGNSSSYRPGEDNPYRKGIPGYSHKALAACLIWVPENLDVDFQYWQVQPNNDWNYAAFYALDKCEKYKRQKSLTCKCQLVDHDDVNVLEVPDDFRTAYESSAKVVKANTAPAVEKNGQRYILDMEWENVLAQRSVFPVSVFKNGGSGTLKSLAPINGANCSGKYDVASNGIGEWEISCDDGVEAVGSLRAKGPNKGSDGSGFDSKGNKITFALIPAPSN